MQLRPYQEKAVRSVLEEWDKGVQKTLLVLPTGTGKTICFAKIIEEQVRKGDRCLILAHRGELLEQAADKLKKATGIESALEKAENSSLLASEMVTIGSMQSLAQEKRLKNFPKDYFQTIVVDEAHHVLSPSYKRILDYFDSAKVLGVTATADRGDMKNLGQYFESQAYEYQMPEAIKEGYLSPIKALQVPLPIDITGVKQSQGDYALHEVGHAIEPYINAIADEMVTYCRDRKTVIFLPLISTSQKMRDILQEKGFSAAEVNGKSQDRTEILQSFDRGDFQVLCNAMLLTEGWDCPSVDCVIVLRPTKVRSLYVQMVGRGTRIHPGKKDLLLLDFLWMTDEHSLCRPSVLIAKDEEVVKKIDEKMAEEAKAFDLEDVTLTCETEVVQDRERTLRETLRQNAKKKKRLVDPMEYTFSVQSINLANYVPSFGWEAKSPTEKQLQTIERMNINPDDIKTAGQANILIQTVIERQKRGLATPKQIRFLEGRGFRHVGTWTMKEASSMIGRISLNNWMIPRGVVPSIYTPARS